MKEITQLKAISLLHNTKYLLGFVFLFSFLIYANTIFNDYNLDDEFVTRNHPLTSKGISAIPDIFLSPYIQDKMGYKYEYRPVVLASYAIEHSLFGESAAVSHFINCLFYAVTVVFFFLLLSKLFWGQDILLSLIISLLFASHPLHTEVVASIKNRDEILALFFALISWIISIRYSENIESKSNAILIIITIACAFLLGILSKQSIIGLAFLIPLSIVLFKKINKNKLLVLCIVYSATTSLMIPLTFLWQKILLLIGLTFLPIAVFFIINNDIILFLKDSAQNLKKLFFANIESDASENNSFEIIKLSGIAFIIFILFEFIGIIAGLYFEIPFINYCCINSVLLSVYILREKSQKEAMFLLFSVFMALHYFYLNGLEDSYNFLIIIYLLVISFNNFLRKSIAIMSLIIIVLPLLIKIDLMFLPYLIIFIFFRLTKNKKVFYSIPLLGIFNIVVFILFFFKTTNWQLYLFHILSSISVIIFLQQKTKKLGLLTILFSFCLLTYFDILIKSKSNDYHLINKVQTYNISANFLPEVDRPVLYMEMPVNMNSPLEERFGTSAFVLGEYIKLMFFPYQLKFYYGYAEIIPYKLNNLQSILSVLFHLFLLIISFIFIKKDKIISFSIIFYLTSILIFSNLFYPLAGVMADRFTYVASIGFCILLGYIFFRLLVNNKIFHSNILFKSAFTLMFFLLIGSYSYATINRNFQWKNHLTLMRHDIKHVEKSAQAHNLLAQNLMKYSYMPEYLNKKEKMHEEALFHFKKSTEIYSGFMNTWFDLGRVYAILNDNENAYNSFLKAYELDSTYSETVKNLAYLAELRKDVPAEIRFLKKYINLKPNVSEPYNRLSYVYYTQGMLRESIEINKRALQYFPNVKQIYQNIALVYMELNDTANANYYLEKAKGL